MKPGTHRCSVALNGNNFAVETTEMFVDRNRLRAEAHVQIVRYGPRGGRYVYLSVHPSDIPALTGALRSAALDLDDWLRDRERNAA